MFGLTQDDKNSALRKALHERDVPAIAAALKKGANPNGTGIQNVLRLFIASGEIDVFMAVLNSGSLNSSSLSDCLIYAISVNNTGIMKALLDKSLFDVAEKTINGDTLLMHALQACSDDAALFLLDRGGGEKRMTPRGESLLSLAAQHGCSTVVMKRILQDTAIDINAAAPRTGQTALHACTQYMRNMPGLLFLLTRPGIRADATDARGKTFLDLLSEGDAQSLFRDILRAAAEHEKTYPLPLEDLLLMAAAAGREELVQVFADAYAAGHRLCPPPNAALRAAAANNDAEICALLLDIGADVNAPGENGRTPLMLAAQNGVAAVALLLARGAQDAAQDGDARTALDYAAHNAAARALLAAGRGVKTGASPFVMFGPGSVEKTEGPLSVVFNFWTGQALYRFPGAPPAAVNFSDIPRQEAVREAHDALKALGGDPPELHDGIFPKKRAAVTLK